jgi:hypothetical protein
MKNLILAVALTLPTLSIASSVNISFKLVGFPKGTTGTSLQTRLKVWEHDLTKCKGFTNLITQSLDQEISSTGTLNEDRCDARLENIALQLSIPNAKPVRISINLEENAEELKLVRVKNKDLELAHSRPATGEDLVLKATIKYVR